MRTHLALALLLLALSASAQKAQEPTLPPMNLAQNWLELLDAGRFGQAWTEAGPSLRGSTDLARWTQDVRKARHSDAAVTCRHGLALEKLDHPPRVAALFVTEFADGHRIGEKVTLPADTAQAASVAAYRTGPPASGRGRPCDSGRPATTGRTP